MNTENYPWKSQIGLNGALVFVWWQAGVKFLLRTRIDKHGRQFDLSLQDGKEEKKLKIIYFCEGVEIINLHRHEHGSFLNQKLYTALHEPDLDPQNFLDSLEKLSTSGVCEDVRYSLASSSRAPTK